MKVKNVVLKTKLCATLFDIYVLISILCNNYIVLFMICQKFRSYLYYEPEFKLIAYNLGFQGSRVYRVYLLLRLSLDVG